MYMIRLTLSLAIWLSWLSVSSASLARPEEGSLSLRKPPAAVDYPRQRASLAPAGALSAHRPAVGLEAEFVMTAATEIFLDGKPCRFEEVPAQASILRMEVAPDRKTVIRVLFRTRK
jgi:hypothetical protein